MRFILAALLFASTAFAQLSTCPQSCFDQQIANGSCNPETDAKCPCIDFYETVTNCVASNCGPDDNLELLMTVMTKCKPVSE